MRKYAANTQVSADKSLSEIKTILRRYGATGFAHIEQGNLAAIIFEAAGRRVRFVLPLPLLEDFANQHRRGPKIPAQRAYDQEVRRRWRALALSILSKLETVASGIYSFDDEFMAQIVLPGGQTMGEWAKPQIERAYTDNQMPPMFQLEGPKTNEL